MEEWMDLSEFLGMPPGHGRRPIPSTWRAYSDITPMQEPEVPQYCEHIGMSAAPQETESVYGCRGDITHYRQPKNSKPKCKQHRRGPRPLIPFYLLAWGFRS